MNTDKHGGAIIPLDETILRMRESFQERLRVLREAMEGWGLRPHHPEDHFVRALVGTQEGLVEVMLASMSTTRQTEERLRERIQMEIDKQTQLTEQIQYTLRSADATLEATCRQVDLKLRRIETDTVRLAGELVEKMVPLSLKALRDAVTIREIRVNRDLEWRRWGIAAACALGVFLLGFAACDYKGWDDFRQASVARAALTLCMHAPPVLDAAQNRYCLMTLFVPK